MIKRTPMTRTEALDYAQAHCADFCRWYVQGELELIWRNSPMPIAEIMAMGFDRSEAQILWNARNR